MRGTVIYSYRIPNNTFIYRYIPDKKGENLDFGGFRVTTLMTKTEDQLVHSELLLEKLGAETDKSLRKIYHWQWKEWYCINDIYCIIQY